MHHHREYHSNDSFLIWKQTFHKSYDSPLEEAHRLLIFMDNLHTIKQHNRGKHSYSMKVNQFSDLTGKEFRQYIHGHGDSCLLSQPISSRPRITNDASERTNHAQVPESVDWAAAGYVTPVKNQLDCGSCWAFSATGCTESRTAIALNVTGKDIVSLSEQELIDCSGSEGNEGCNGGYMTGAFKYMEKSGGLCSEAEYPYTAQTGIVCKAHQCYKAYDPISGYSNVGTNSYASLEAAVAEGPVSVAVEADQKSWQHYSSGVMDSDCGIKLDHGVLVVGYGTLNGEKFWKVKNSWGEEWGMEGYLLICRECQKNGNDGECGILMSPSYDIANVTNLQ